MFPNFFLMKESHLHVFANYIFPYFTLLHIVYEYMSSSDIYILIYFNIISMSVVWVVCQGQPPWHAKDRFTGFR